MAYDFDGIDDYMEVASSVVTAVPLTIACWFKADNVTTNYNLINVSTSTGTDRWTLQLAGAVAGDPVRAQTSAGGSTAQSATGTGYTAGTWYHGAARFSANNNRRGYIDGVGGTANTTSLTPSGTDTTNVGCLYTSSTRSSFMDGQVAECGIWSVALTDDEIASLARGYRCSLVRPSSLVFYAPLVREIRDLMRGASITSSAPVVAVHPRRIA